MQGDDTAPLVIGWKEKIDFPAWGIRGLRAKIDTGAWTTALDVCECHLVELGPGRFRAQFSPVLHRRKGTCGPMIDAEVVRMVLVRNTGGTDELRPVVETEIRLGSLVKRIRLTLTDRSRMRSPVILGRSALAGDVVVDVSRRYVQRRRRETGPR
jgi:hypothetical protein